MTATREGGTDDDGQGTVACSFPLFSYSYRVCLRVAGVPLCHLARHATLVLCRAEHGPTGRAMPSRPTCPIIRLDLARAFGLC